MKSKQTNNKKQLSPFVSPFLSSGFQRSQKDMDMDWSMDTPQAPVSPSLYFFPTKEHVLSPHVPLHNMGSNSKNRAEFTAPSVLDYSEGQLSITSSWDGAHQVLSIFGTEDTIFKDAKMIFNFIRRLRSDIKHHPVDKVPPKGEFVLVIEYLWKLIDTIYTAKWDSLIFNKEKTLTIRKCVREHIVLYYRQNQLLTLTLNMKMNTPSPLPSAEDVSPPTTNTSVAPPLPNKNVKSTIKKAPKPLNMKKSYV